MNFDTKKTLKISLSFAWISVLAAVMDTVTAKALVNQFGASLTEKGVWMAMDNILGLFLLPIFGSLSDKCNSKYGKRTPYIVAGSAVAIFAWFMAGVGLMVNSKIMFLVFLTLGLGSIATARPAALSLLPDVTCFQDRRRANSINQIVSIVFTLIGVVVCMLGVSPDIKTGESSTILNVLGIKGGAMELADGSILENAKYSYYFVYMFSAVLMLGLLLWFIKVVNERKLVDDFRREHPDEVGLELTAEQEKMLETGSGEYVPVSDILRFGNTVADNIGKPVYEKINTKNYALRARLFMLACVFCFYVSFNGLTSSLSLYAEEVLNLSGGKFVLPQLLCMVAAMAVAVPCSKLTKRLGRKNSIIWGLAIMLVAFLIAGQERGLTTSMFFAFILAGFGYSMALVNFYPFFLELTSNENLGRNTGMFNNAMMAAMIFTPIVSGWLTDQMGMRVLFPYCSIALVLSLVCIALVPRYISYNDKIKD